MPQIKVKKSPGRQMAQAASGPSFWAAKGVEYAQTHRYLVTIGMVGGVMIALCVAAVLVYNGQQRWQGLRELQQGMLLLQKGDPAGAVSHLERAERRLPPSGGRPLASLYLGQAYAAQQQSEGARLAYEKALPAARRDSYLAQIALLHLGQEAERYKDFAQARQWYSEAVDLEGPFKATAMLAQARALEMLNEKSAAQAVYERFLEQDPDSPLAESIRLKVRQ